MATTNHALDIPDGKRATLEQTLDFCNAVREAGGAAAIHALMPSEPQAASACLIARNLNFGCTVDTITSDDDDVNGRWAMSIDDLDVAERVAEKLNLTLWDEYEDRVYEAGHSASATLLLPHRIGQVAYDFDQWTNGVVGDQYEEFTPYVEASENYTRVETGAN